MTDPKQSNSIKNWSEDDRPREKLMANGAKALTNAELLAILIGSGSKSESAVDLSRKILMDVDNDLNLLSKKSVAQLTDYKGIGEAKAITIVAAMELVNRKRFEKVEKRKITSSKDVHEEMFPILIDKDQEEFWALFLNRKNAIIEKKKISMGGVGSTIVDLKIIFRYAIESLASGLILVHNHPSENPNPSEGDISLTVKIQNAALFFDIKLLDHIIFAGAKYYSFADEGTL
jgi:DNA repair protein RadC